MSTKLENIAKNITAGNIKLSRSISSRGQVSDKRFLDKAGISLAIIVLIAIIIEIYFIGKTVNHDPIQEFHQLTETYPDLLKHDQAELRKFVAEQIQANRDYISDMSKTVLVNVLLPILTAILGYIFGSREGSQS